MLKVFNICCCVKHEDDDVITMLQNASLAYVNVFFNPFGNKSNSVDQHRCLILVPSLHEAETSLELLIELVLHQVTTILSLYDVPSVLSLHVQIFMPEPVLII